MQLNHYLDLGVGKTELSRRFGVSWRDTLRRAAALSTRLAVADGEDAGAVRLRLPAQHQARTDREPA